MINSVFKQPGLWLVAVLLLPSWHLAAQEREPGPGILAPFKQKLQEALRAGLAEGPVQAIAACQLQAPGIAEALSQDDIRVGRTSHRLRNASNIAPAWVAPILDDYASDPSDREPRTVSVGENHVGYVEPIFVQPMCLTCHGTSLAPDVASRLQALYPEDRAIGYRVGDLRGVFWVKFPVAKD